MADETGIKVPDLRNIMKAIEAIGVPREELKAASQAAAEIAAGEARTLVPVRTGALRNSIRVGKSYNKVTIMAGGARVPYANPIHWGWYKRHIRPNPFFSKALGYSRDEIYQTYFRQLEALITAETSKIKITK